MRNCAAWSASGSFAVFAWTDQTTIGWRANPGRRSVRDARRALRPAEFQIRFSCGASDAVAFIHSIPRCFARTQRHRRRGDVSQFVLGLAVRRIEQNRVAFDLWFSGFRRRYGRTRGLRGSRRDALKCCLQRRECEFGRRQISRSGIIRKILENGVTHLFSINSRGGTSIAGREHHIEICGGQPNT